MLTSFLTLAALSICQVQTSAGTATSTPAQAVQPAPTTITLWGRSDCSTCGQPTCDPEGGGFCYTFCKAYRDEFFPKKEDKKDNCASTNGEKKEANGNGGEKKNGESANNPCTGNGDSKPEPFRRALPAPFQSPPFPGAEWQGFPLVGVPPAEPDAYPLTKALYASGEFGQWLKENRIRAYGWINGSMNVSNCTNSNTPFCYWVDPNTAALDQALIRFEREVDTVQTDHCDWGFRATFDYGVDYRYFTAGGWFSDQLLVHNRLYGFDGTELYANFYVPWVAQGMIITVGRWVATPDIETQFAPDNYMGSHSLQFTIDVYTETGIMATVMLDRNWTVQAALHAGADMAPWYDGAVPTGMFGVRWVADDNCDSVYTVLNAINNAEFQYFDVRGMPAGHHNYNIIQSTWQHKFSDQVITKTEAYLIWERDAAVGGTPSIGPFQFNSGGGLGPTVPGLSLTYSVLNYTMFKVSDKAFVTFRNEWVKDENGTRYGFPGNYTGNAIGLTYNFNSLLQIRPELGYYRNWNNLAFDNGARHELLIFGVDMTLRF